MRLLPILQNRTVRFRRWSRNGYAIFRSLQIQVTIGQLTKSISDKALDKLNILSEKSIGLLEKMLFDSDNANDSDPVEFLEKSVNQTICIQIYTSDAPAQNLIYNYLTITVDRKQRSYQPFFNFFNV